MLSLMQDFVFKRLDGMSKWSQLGNQIWIERGKPLFDELRYTQENINPTLIQALDLPDPLKRGWAAELLGCRKATEAEEALQSALANEPYDIVKQKINLALERIKRTE